MSDIPAGRICKKCGQWKPLDEFHKDKYGKYGRHSRCKECKCRYHRERHPKQPATIERRRLRAQGLKNCSKCNQAKPLNEFYKQARPGIYSAYCKVCGRASALQWASEHKEARAAYMRKWQEDHKEERQAYRTRYRKDNIEKIRAAKRKYYAEHLEYRKKRRTAEREWRKAHKKQQQAYHREYRLKNHEAVSASVSRWRTENIDKVRDYKRKWYYNNPHKVKAAKSRRRAHKAAVPNNFTSDDWLEVLDKQDYKCKYCGAPFSDELPPEVDHVHPLSKGGSHTIGNIVAACRPCNASKSDKLPEQIQLI